MRSWVLATSHFWSILSGGAHPCPQTHFSSLAIFGISIAPDGVPAFLTMVYARALCLQGGGVAVVGGTVTFQSCEIHDNTAVNVRAHHFPHLEAIRSPPMGCLLFS